MKIIYRYIFKELVAPLFFGIAAFAGISIGTDLLFRLIDYHNRYGADLFILLQLFFLSLPGIIVVTFPMATLLGVILAYGRLSGDNEITALRAGGVSIYRLVIPALVIGILMTILTIGTNEFLVPQANNLYEQLYHQVRYGEKLPSSQRNLVLPRQDSRGRLDFFLYTRFFDGDTGVMEGVLFQNYEDGKPVSIIEAEKGVWKEGQWKFIEGKISYLRPGERIPAIEFSEFNAGNLSYTPEQISRGNKSIDEMNYKELREHIAILETQGRNVNSELVKYYQRFSIPFANFIFALLAVSLGIQPRRSGGSATGLGLSIIVIFIYYTMMTFGSALGEKGTIPPLLAAWGQNFIFLIIGGIMLHRAGK